MEGTTRLMGNLPIDPRSEITDRIADTGFVWHEGETLHASGVLLWQEGSESDLLPSYLACRLGIVRKVRLTTYLFRIIPDRFEDPIVALKLLTKQQFSTFISIFGKGVTIELENQDKKILLARVAGEDYCQMYEEAYCH